MKKVILFANSTWCIYNFRLNLMKALLENGCSVHVLAPLDPTYENATFIKRFEELGVTFHEIPLQPRGINPLRELLSIAKIFVTLRKIRADVVLSYTVKCNIYAGFCQRFLGFTQAANIPGLGEVFERRSTLAFIVSALYRVAFRGMSKAFFQNREDLSYCLEHRLVPADRCTLVPGSGVDLVRFQPAPPPRQNGKRIFLMFGRVLSQKGYPEYLQAAETVKKLFGESVEFRVMGIEDKNRPDSIKLFGLLREAEQKGVIRLIPTAINVVPVLADVDAVVLPSRYNEGIPRSLLEAMAMAKVIITTDWRGCRETVDHGRNGYLVPLRSVPDLVQAISTVVSLEDDEIRAMGLKSRALVEHRFDERRVLNEYLEFALGFVPEASADDADIGLEANAGTLHSTSIAKPEIRTAINDA